MGAILLLAIKYHNIEKQSNIKHLLQLETVEDIYREFYNQVIRGQLKFHIN